MSGTRSISSLLTKQGTDARRAEQALVAAHGQEVDRQFTHIDGHVPGRLRRVKQNDGTRRMRQRCDLPHGKQPAEDIGCMIYRHQPGVRPQFPRYRLDKPVVRPRNSHYGQLNPQVNHSCQRAKH